MSRQVLVLVSVLCCSVAQWKSVPAQEVQRKPNIVILFIVQKLHFIDDINIILHGFMLW